MGAVLLPPVADPTPADRETQPGCLKKRDGFLALALYKWRELIETKIKPPRGSHVTVNADASSSDGDVPAYGENVLVPQTGDAGCDCADESFLTPESVPPSASDAAICFDGTQCDP
jgi:hypothetical protein